MKQVKVNNILYVIDTEAYQITEDTDVRIILVPEDSYEDYVAAQWGQPGELITGNEVARIQGVIGKMQKYNYNCIVVNVPEYVTAMEEMDEVVIYVDSTSEYTKIVDTYNIRRNHINYIKVDDVKLSNSEIDNIFNTSDWQTKGKYKMSIGSHIVKISFVEPNSEFDYNDVFSNCQDFVKVIIPKSWKYTFQTTFNTCVKLQEIVIKSNKITKIGNSFAYYCTNLERITFPNSLTEIGNSSFSSSGIKSINIPNGVTKLGQACFYQCTKLTDVTLPSTITEINGACFQYDNKLTSITINATSVPTLNKSEKQDDQGTLYVNDAFDSTNNCPIYVPAESVAAYKAATNWSKYASRIQAIPSE